MSKKRKVEDGGGTVLHEPGELSPRSLKKGRVAVFANLAQAKERGSMLKIVRAIGLRKISEQLFQELHVLFVKRDQESEDHVPLSDSDLNDLTLYATVVAGCRPLFRVIRGEEERERFFLKLSAPAHSLTTLSQEVPRGYANASKLLLALHRYKLPIDRAVWFAKVVCLYDRQSRSVAPRRFWTEALLAAIRDSSTGKLDGVAGVTLALSAHSRSDSGPNITEAQWRTARQAVYLDRLLTVSAERGLCDLGLVEQELFELAKRLYKGLPPPAGRSSNWDGTDARLFLRLLVACLPALLAARQCSLLSLVHLVRALTSRLLPHVVRLPGLCYTIALVLIRHLCSRNTSSVRPLVMSGMHLQFLCSRLDRILLTTIRSPARQSKTTPAMLPARLPLAGGPTAAVLVDNRGGGCGSQIRYKSAQDPPVNDDDRAGSVCDNDDGYTSDDSSSPGSASGCDFSDCSSDTSDISSVSSSSECSLTNSNDSLEHSGGRGSLSRASSRARDAVRVDSHRALLEPVGQPPKKLVMDVAHRFAEMSFGFLHEQWATVDGLATCSRMPQSASDEGAVSGTAYSGGSWPSAVVAGAAASHRSSDVARSNGAASFDRGDPLDDCLEGCSFEHQLRFCLRAFDKYGVAPLNRFISRIDQLDGAVAEALLPSLVETTFQCVIESITGGCFPPVLGSSAAQPSWTSRATVASTCVGSTAVAAGTKFLARVCHHESPESIVPGQRVLASQVNEHGCAKSRGGFGLDGQGRFATKLDTTLPGASSRLAVSTSNSKFPCLFERLIATACLRILDRDCTSATSNSVNELASRSPSSTAPALRFFVGDLVRADVIQLDSLVRPLLSATSSLVHGSNVRYPLQANDRERLLRLFAGVPVWRRSFDADGTARDRAQHGVLVKLMSSSVPRLSTASLEEVAQSDDAHGNSHRVVPRVESFQRELVRPFDTVVSVERQIDILFGQLAKLSKRRVLQNDHTESNTSPSGGHPLMAALRAGERNGRNEDTVAGLNSVMEAISLIQKSFQFIVLSGASFRLHSLFKRALEFPVERYVSDLCAHYPAPFGGDVVLEFDQDGSTASSVRYHQTRDLLMNQLIEFEDSLVQAGILMVAVDAATVLCDCLVHFKLQTVWSRWTARFGHLLSPSSLDRCCTTSGIENMPLATSALVQASLAVPSPGTPMTPSTPQQQTPGSSQGLGLPASQGRSAGDDGDAVVDEFLNELNAESCQKKLDKLTDYARRLSAVCERHRSYRIGEEKELKLALGILQLPILIAQKTWSSCSPALQQKLLLSVFQFDELINHECVHVGQRGAEDPARNDSGVGPQITVFVQKLLKRFAIEYAVSTKNDQRTPSDSDAFPTEDHARLLAWWMVFDYALHGLAWPVSVQQRDGHYDATSGGRLFDFCRMVLQLFVEPSATVSGSMDDCPAAADWLCVGASLGRLFRLLGTTMVVCLVQTLTTVAAEDSYFDKFGPSANHQNAVGALEPLISVACGCFGVNCSVLPASSSGSACAQLARVLVDQLNDRTRALTSPKAKRQLLRQSARLISFRNSTLARLSVLAAIAHRLPEQDEEKGRGEKPPSVGNARDSLPLTPQDKASRKRSGAAQYSFVSRALAFGRLRSLVELSVIRGTDVPWFNWCIGVLDVAAAAPTNFVDLNTSPGGWAFLHREAPGLVRYF